MEMTKATLPTHIKQKLLETENLHIQIHISHAKMDNAWEVFSSSPHTGYVLDTCKKKITKQFSGVIKGLV